MKNKRSHDEEMIDSRVEITSGSIYEELGFKDSKAMEAKSLLVMEITKAIKKKAMTQTEAAEVLGLSQPKLSALLCGHFRGYSVERLMHFLTLLGKDVDIIIKSKPRSRKARVSVHSSPNVSNTRMVAKSR